MNEPPAPLAIVTGGQYQGRYTNWQGVTAHRRIQVLGLLWGQTPYHPEPGWLLRALDLDKREERLFSLRDFGEIAAL